MAFLEVREKRPATGRFQNGAHPITYRVGIVVVSTVGASSHINARIGHLAERKCAALECAHAAAGAAAVEQTAAREFLGRELPEIVGGARVPDAPASLIGRLGCGLPNLRQLGCGYILVSNVAVEDRLRGGARELYHDRSHFFCEVGMTNQTDPQIGVQSSPVRLA
jgi:hypothetical protein